MVSQGIWRRDLLRLAQGLEEDLSELRHIRPTEETASTLDVFVQGLVRVWTDMGFSDDEIRGALAKGQEHDFDLDPAWDAQKYETRAWKTASATHLGKALATLQVLGVWALLLGFFGLILNLGLVVAGRPASLIAWASMGLFGAGLVFLVVSTTIQSRLQSRHLKRIQSQALSAGQA